MEIYFWKWIYELILLNWKAIYRHQWFPNLCGQMSMLKQILTQVQWKSACWSPKLSQVSILNKKEINRIIEKIWHFPEKIFALLGHFILYEINYLLHFKLFKLIINKINKFKIRKFYRDFNGMHFSFCFLFTDVKLKITTIYNHQNMPLLSWKIGFVLLQSPDFSQILASLQVRSVFGSASEPRVKLVVLRTGVTGVKVS